MHPLPSHLCLQLRVRELLWRGLVAMTRPEPWGSRGRIRISVRLLFPTESWGKNYGENADLSLAKSSLSHNYLNLTFPRKRTPRVSVSPVFVLFLFARGWGKGKGQCHALSRSVLMKCTDQALVEDGSKTRLRNQVFVAVPLAPCSQLQ